MSPRFFPEKTCDFLVITVSQFSGVTPIYFLLKTDDLFCSSLTITFINFTRVSPRTLFTFFYPSDLVSPLFFVNLPTKNFHLGVTPCRVSPGAVHPLQPPSNATACDCVKQLSESWWLVGVCKGNMLKEYLLIAL